MTSPAAASAPNPQLESLYQEIILEHYRSPHHRGLREPFEAQVHHLNPTCGDEITLRVHLNDGVVEDVSYDGQGCSISQAAASVMTDLVIGKSIDDALGLHDEFLKLMQSKGEMEPDEDILEDAIAFAGVSKYPARIKCALLAWMAWKDATAQAASTDEARSTDDADSVDSSRVDSSRVDSSRVDSSSVEFESGGNS